MTEKMFNPDYQGAVVRPSPNFEDRKNAAKPQFLILHYTGMENAESAETLLCSPPAKVSAHYVVEEDGRIVQLVGEAFRAWHAGESFWHGVTDINSHSIGIEIVNGGPLLNFPDYPQKQIAAVIALCRSIIARHGILARNVLGHSDIAPYRKIDPGEKFPWASLYKNGVGHFVQPAEISGGRFMSMGESGRPVEAFQSMLALYGYGVDITGVFDERTRLVTEAFQRHFRPKKIDGVADVSTIDTLHRLLGTLKKLT
ncbi:N-acetylmuramoyl-L-alanine amidase [uncultured Bartonella sp.]|uniref:N-acetylmuramoyl-L-alanine amidase n=1 Tax=uncultured Bartonella sp. TaxID=104108 RepID=UPI00262DB65F|nr:N-acetylmuramoyl-L-alanine amidase [uncultured Bartonella sp.]